MIDILRDYLGGAASPEYMQMIGDAHEAIATFDLPEFNSAFEQILMTDDEVDQGQTVQQIYDQTRATQVELLKALGITVSDDARVDHLTVLINGLQGIEDYQDPQALLQQCALEMHPEELLAEVLSLTTHLSPEELLVDIHGVSQMTINKIKDVCHERLSDEDPQDFTALHQKYIDAYREIRNEVGGLDLVLDHLLMAGVDVGYPFVLYANLVGHQFEGMPVANIAANLLSMAMISSDGYEAPRPVIQTHIENLIGDLDLITKVDVAIGDLMLKIQIKKTSGVKHG